MTQARTYYYSFWCAMKVNTYRGDVGDALLAPSSYIFLRRRFEACSNYFREVCGFFIRTISSRAHAMSARSPFHEPIIIAHVSASYSKGGAVAVFLCTLRV